jgi:hypothetical protein
MVVLHDQATRQLLGESCPVRAVPPSILQFAFRTPGDTNSMPAATAGVKNDL